MTRTQSLRTGVWLGVLLVGIAGCGAMQSTPDNPTGAGGLMPNVEDKDAGLVAVAPGFDLKRYKVVAVEPFPVTDATSKDEGDRRFAAQMAGFLHLELVRRLKTSGLFQTVVNTSQTQFKPGAQPALRLQGAITRLGRGSQVARYFAGLYGGGGPGPRRTCGSWRRHRVAWSWSRPIAESPPSAGSAARTRGTCRSPSTTWRAIWRSSWCGCRRARRPGSE